MSDRKADIPVRKAGSGDAEADAAEDVLDARIQEMIGRSLQAHFDDLVRAPMPDKFLVLLAQLEAKERDGQ